ncbi:MAG TPA: tyrosine/phenylalanine carboxypeptidase domain-containing protein [Acidimicrobiia bacterium]
MPVSERDLMVDRELADVAGLLPLLSLITPTNVPEARKAFFAGESPVFVYRDLPDLAAISSRLDRIDPTTPDDATVSHLAEGLKKELKLRLELLRNRDTDQAFFVAVELFGHVEDKTLTLAEQILDRSPAPRPPEPTVNAEVFATLARAEVEGYRRVYPELSARVILTDSRPGVMVEAGDLYVPFTARVGETAIPALLAHEIGTHVLTFANGRCQPLHMLSLGLAGYDELQEALGVLAEHLAGGLAFARLRTLASRVLVAHRRAIGLTFREAHDELLGLGFRPGEAFTTVMRAYRAGGNTKDAIYLRGLVRLVEHVQSGVDLMSLYVGKISFEAIPLIAELSSRGILDPAPLRPRFIEDVDAQRRLKEVVEGKGVLEMGDRAA